MADAPLAGSAPRSDGGSALHPGPARLRVSWRFTIDRERPGGLVTNGVFALTRNPVYLALLLVAGGVAVALGDAFLLFLAGASFLYFRHLVQREEQFLAVHYGEEYASYRESVPAGCAGPSARRACDIGRRGAGRLRFGWLGATPS